MQAETFGVLGEEGESVPEPAGLGLVARRRERRRELVQDAEGPLEIELLVRGARELELVAVRFDADPGLLQRLPELRRRRDPREDPLGRRTDLRGAVENLLRAPVRLGVPLLLRRDLGGVELLALEAGVDAHLPELDELQLRVGDRFLAPNEL